MSTFNKQLAKIKNDKGFIAALDESGGSTPKALKLYGIDETAWKDEKGMYDVVHAMRTRIITSPAFSGKRLIGAILFENTIDRDIEGKPTPVYLWDVKGVVPFLKVDKGLADEKDGVQLMKAIPDLGALLKRAKAKNVFGTKMRSVIKQANPAGIEAVVKQQFDVGKEIIAAGLVPIIIDNITRGFAWIGDIGKFAELTNQVFCFPLASFHTLTVVDQLINDSPQC